jgi:steroid delta-isomerase-like uncharacterized protein
MPQQNPNPDVNKQVVQRFVEECWNQGNLNAVSEYLADQVRFHDPVFPNLGPGIQNVKNHIEQCRKAFPDFRFNIEDTIAERNEVVLHWKAHGTHKGPFLGMQPTNQKFNVDGTSIYRLENSKIVEEYANWNLATMMQQLGIIEIPKEVRSSHESRQEVRSQA